MSDESGHPGQPVHEERRFEPPDELAENANLTAEAYDEAEKPTGSASGRSRPSGSTGTPSGTRSSTGTTRPFAKWFVGGKINAAYNCVDRHVENGDGDKVAFHWVGEPEDDTRDITYAELKDEVCKAANALIELGVETGDRVAIYMPMIPETVDRDAGLCAPRRPAHRRVRRVLLRRPGQPARGLRRPAS